jgi:hypothetical protein
MTTTVNATRASTSIIGALVRTGVLATVAASAATMAVAAAGHAAGISLDLGGALMLTHLVAAAIVIPAVARRLAA